MQQVYLIFHTVHIFVEKSNIWNALHCNFEIIQSFEYKSKHLEIIFIGRYIVTADVYVYVV